MSESHIACPTCGKQVPLSQDERTKSFPFCSDRCRTVDLGGWSDEKFVIKGKELNVEQEED